MCVGEWELSGSGDGADPSSSGTLPCGWSSDGWESMSANTAHNDKSKGSKCLPSSSSMSSEKNPWNDMTSWAFPWSCELGSRSLPVLCCPPEFTSNRWLGSRYDHTRICLTKEDHDHCRLVLWSTKENNEHDYKIPHASHPPYGPVIKCDLSMDDTSRKTLLMAVLLCYGKSFFPARWTRRLPWRIALFPSTTPYFLNRIRELEASGWISKYYSWFFYLYIYLLIY